MEKKTASAIMLTLLLTSMLTLAFNIQPAKASETIIDTHGDSRFTKYPSGPYWWSVADHDAFHTRAYNNNFWYTYCGDAAHGGDLYFGMWTPSVIGEYEVFVWIPNPDPFGTYTPTHSANYQIWHSSGLTERVVNQALRLGGWYSLGSFTFDASSSIILNDRTGEPYISTMVAFDAIKFTQVVPPRTLTVSSAHDSPNPSNGAHSYSNGQWVTCSVTSPADQSGGTRYRCTGYTGTGSCPSGTGTSVTFAITQDSTIVWNWAAQYSLTVASAHDSPSPSVGTWWYDSGASLTCSVTSPAEGYSCTGWTGTGSVPSSGSATSTSPFIITQGSAITWNWIVTPPVPRTLTVYSSPSGVSFTAKGTSHTTPWSGTYNNGDSVSLVMPSTYSAGDPRYYWDKWSDGVTSPSRTITLNSDTTLTGSYIGPYYELIIASSPVSGIPFTLNGTSKTTAYSEWLYQGYYTIEMPTTYNEYLWQHWYEDSDTNRVKTVLLATSTTLTAIYSAPQTEPPVARADPLYTYPSSGRVVVFDGTRSYDPDGGEIRHYWWNFGDGEEAEGATVEHRFRGAMDQSKRYTVKLTVADDEGYLGFCEVVAEVKPLQKTIEVPVGYVGEQLDAYARMTAYYNWIGITVLENGQSEDLYLISKIHFEGDGYISYLLSVWDTYSHSIGIPAWSHGFVLLGLGVSKDFVYPFDTYRDATYHFEGDGDFQGLVVGPSDRMSLSAFNPKGVPGLIFVGADPGRVSASFDPDSLSQTETPNAEFAYLGSPGELRVYDSQGRVTGLVNGEIKEEIPYSIYNSSLVVIFFPSDSYRYNVVGTGEGLYTLILTNTSVGQEDTCFKATYIPTNTTTIHQYVVDWAALSLGGEGVIVKVDSDGDSVPEYTFTSDSELTQNEFLIQTGQSALYTFSIVWGEETFIVSVESNSTVSNFAFSPGTKSLSFTVNGTSGTGFCNVTIPKALLHAAPSDWAVLIDGTPLPPIAVTLTENATHSCLYFTYAHSTHEVQIIGTWVIGPPPPPLSVSISPLSASLVLGQSVTFTSTVSGGVTPYGYQWYVNSALVPSATSASWTFTPSTSGIYYVYLKVTDASSNASQSETARIVVVTVPVGGYSIAIGPQTKAEPVLPYIALIAALTAVFTKLRPKTKRKR